MKIFLSFFLLTISLFSQNIDYSRLRNTPQNSQFTQTGSEYPTFAAACDGAVSAGKTLFVAKVFTNITTRTYACNLEFTYGGKLVFASGAVATLTGSVVAPPIQIFDYSVGGSVILSGQRQPAYFQWWGVICDDSTNNATTLGYAFAAFKSFQMTKGVCRFGSTISSIQVPGTTIQGAGAYNSIFRFTGSGAGFSLNAGATAGMLNINGVGLVADGASSSSMFTLTNTTHVVFRDVVASQPADFGLTPLSGNNASTAYFIIAASGGGNCYSIVFDHTRIAWGSGAGIKLTASGGEGNIVTIVNGSTIEANVDPGLYAPAGSGSGPHVVGIHSGSVFQGNGNTSSVAQTQVWLDWATNFSTEGSGDFENSAGVNHPLIILATNGTVKNARISGLFGGTDSDSCVSIAGTAFGITFAGGRYECKTRLVNLTGVTFKQISLENVILGGTISESFNSNVYNAIISQAGVYKTVGNTFLPVFTQTYTLGSLNTVVQGNPENQVTDTSTTNYQPAGNLTGFTTFGSGGSANIPDNFCVTVKLNVPLQVGANTFNLGGGGAFGIKRHTDPTADLTTAYAVGGRPKLCWAAAVSKWLDAGQ